MAPVYINEYRSRQDYYDNWLREHLGDEDGLPDSPEARHQTLLELRQDAYQRLCDVVYEFKGYSPDGVPLPETLERFALLDKKAKALLEEHGL